jgi:methyltransferase (TIGR00027 family)
VRNPFLPAHLHTTERPSSTAQWTALGRTFELARPPAERIVTDEYAPLFLSSGSRAVLAPLRIARPLVQLAERHPVAGVSAFGLCRHRFIDEHLCAALADPGTKQVLILGAGYDSRAYRFADELDGRPVYEVDLPPLSRRKAGIVAAHPDRFAGNRINRVEIDFRADSLAERLDESGFAIGARTFVAWEGVSMYLSHVAIADTLDTLGEVCGPGSTLALDFWHRLPGVGPRPQLRRLGARAIVLIGRRVRAGSDCRRVDIARLAEPSATDHRLR